MSWPLRIATLSKGVPEYAWIDGQYVRRLRGVTGRALIGATSKPLYGRTA